MQSEPKIMRRSHIGRAMKGAETMSIIGAVTFGVMAIIGLVAAGYLLYGLFMTVDSLVRSVEFHVPQIHHTGGLASHH